MELFSRRLPIKLIPVDILNYFAFTDAASWFGGPQVMELFVVS